MNFKTVFRIDPDNRLIRLFRLTYNAGTVGDGKGYSVKNTLALSPRLFGFHREFQAWFLTLFGLRFHRVKSCGGIFC